MIYIRTLQPSLEVIRDNPSQWLNSPEIYAPIVREDDNRPLHVMSRKVEVPGVDRALQLLILGTKHRPIPQHFNHYLMTQFMNAWERKTRSITAPNRRIMVGEGSPEYWMVRNTIQESIEVQTDAGLLHYAAQVYDRYCPTPIIPGEPHSYGEVIDLIKEFPWDEVATYYIMRDSPRQIRMQGDKPSLEEFTRSNIDTLNRILGRHALLRPDLPPDFSFNYDNYIDKHKEFFNGELPGPHLQAEYLRYTSAELEPEEFRNQRLARVALGCMRFRDAHTLKTIVDLLLAGYDIAVVEGNHHTTALASAIQKIGQADFSFDKNRFLPHPSYLEVQEDFPSFMVKQYEAFLAFMKNPAQVRTFQEGLLMYPEKGQELSSIPMLKLLPQSREVDRYSADQAFPGVWPQADALTPVEFVYIDKSLFHYDFHAANQESAYFQRLTNKYVTWDDQFYPSMVRLERAGEHIRPDPSRAELARHAQGTFEEKVRLHSHHSIDTVEDERLLVILNNAFERVYKAFESSVPNMEHKDYKIISHDLTLTFKSIRKTLQNHNLSDTEAVVRFNDHTKHIAALGDVLLKDNVIIDIVSQMDEHLRVQYYINYIYSLLNFSTLRHFNMLVRLDHLGITEEDSGTTFGLRIPDIVPSIEYSPIRVYNRTQ